MTEDEEEKTFSLRRRLVNISRRGLSRTSNRPQLEICYQNDCRDRVDASIKKCIFPILLSGPVLGQDTSSALVQNVPSCVTSCRLLNLQSNTAYLVNIFIVSWAQTSCPSNILEFSTLDEGANFGKMLTKLYKSIGNVGGLYLFPVPLSKLSQTTSRNWTIEPYIFGKPCADQKEHKTILLVGATAYWFRQDIP